MRYFSAVLLVIVATANAQNFECPTENGLFADAVQCDKYYECKHGFAKEKLCPDGLVFDENIRRFSKCDQPFNVDCGDRTELQTPKGTNEYCPRKNGIFSHPDETVCDVFYNCVDGEHTETKCQGGLYFDETSGTCVWPELAQRENCEQQQRKLKDGFSCPKEKVEDATGQKVVHPQYVHPTDCQKFYVCLSGIEPRELKCEDGQVFDEELSKCNSPDQVPGCEDWYKPTTDSQ